MMKRYYTLLALIWVTAIVIGLLSRQSRIDVAIIEHKAAMPIPTSITQSTVTPELVAVPLGSFTPNGIAAVSEYPNQTARITGELAAGESVEFTSEYRHLGELWLCVVWEVDQNNRSWNCTGWALAEDGEILGTLERYYELAPQVEVSNDA
jgi:hypothetical protein